MKQVARLLSVITWLLVAGSVVIITGGMFGRPLLLAAVPTGSMVPTLMPGDLIVVLPTWAMQPPGLDGIVVFKTAKDRDWVVHRIVDGNTTEGFITKGDANQTADPNRVFARDIAGLVPQWGGKALRLPRLGVLSMAEGPLSNPIVAGVALVMGVYLLVLDLRPNMRIPRLPHLRRTRVRPEAVLSLYLGLAGTAFVTTLIPAWTMSHRQYLDYEIVLQRPSNHTKQGQYILGQEHVEEFTIENSSPLPIAVVLVTDDPHVAFDKWWAVLPPRAARTFTAVVDNPYVGKHEAQMLTGVYLPLLPTFFQASLTRSGIGLAAVVTAMVPGVIILMLALFDARCRVAIGRVRTRISLHFNS